MTLLQYYQGMVILSSAFKSWGEHFTWMAVGQVVTISCTKTGHPYIFMAIYLWYPGDIYG